MDNQDVVLQEEKSHLSIISHVPGGILRLNCENQEFEIDFYNDELLSLFGCDGDTLTRMGRDIFKNFVHEEDKEAVIRMVYDTDTPYGELIHRIRDYRKNEKWVLMKFRKEMENENVRSIYFIIVDIDEKKQSEINWMEQIWHDALVTFALDTMAKAKYEHAAIQSLMEYICGYFKLDMAAIVELNDDRMETTYLVEPSEYMNQSFKEMDLSMLKHVYDFSDQDGVLAVEDVDDLRSGSPMKALMSQTKAKAALCSAFFEDGEYKGCIYLEDRQHYREWTRRQISTLVTVARMLSFYLVKMRVTDKIKQKLDRLRNYDSLTGLPTMRLFMQRIEALRLQYPERSWAIIYTDINDLKVVNESFGYDFGDQILCDVAAHLRSIARSDRVFARASSNNFLFMTPYSSDQEITDYLVELKKTLHDHGRKKSVNCNLTFVSGIYILRPEDDNLAAAIDNANIARKHAKNSSGKELYYFYNNAMHERLKQEQEITNQMENALLSDEFVVYLQPKMDLARDGIAGAEARWVRGDGRILMPDEFIPIFEKNGFILKMDYFVYETVCKKMREWLDRGGKVMPVSVNVSRVHLMEEDFVGEVLRLVDQYGIDRNLLEFELTESIFLDNTEVALVFMSRIRDLGFNASIDDFGAGYSSLSLLKDINMDVLKLDKEFFRKGDMKREDQIIVSSIINMAKQLNVKVLSEGVETTMQSEFLKAMDCDMAQGFLFSKPMPIEDFEKKYIYA